MVTISYGKGVIIFQQYDKMNGEYFKQFVTENFNVFFLNVGTKMDGYLFKMVITVRIVNLQKKR